MSSSREEIDTTATERLLSLCLIEGKLPNWLRRVINDKAETFLNSDFAGDVAEFLKNELHEEQHTEEDMRTLIRAVPASLVFQGYGEFSRKPLLQIVATRNEGALPFLPLLAEEASRSNVSGVGPCDPRIWFFAEDSTLLETICRYGTKNCLKVLKRLRQMNIFREEDITKYKLLHRCLRSMCLNNHDGAGWDIFNFFIDWDPAAMKKWRGDNGRNLIQHAILKIPNDRILPGHFIKGLLCAGISLYPDQLGLLFEKDHDNDHASNLNSAWECGCEKLGRKNMWNVVKDCLEETGNDDLLDEKCNHDGSSIEDADPTPTFSFSTVFLAAKSEHVTIELDITYHLLKKNPAKWLEFQDFEGPPAVTAQIATSAMVGGSKHYMNMSDSKTIATKRKKQCS